MEKKDKKVKKPRKPHRGLWTILCILLAFAGFYIWGSIYYQKSFQINRILEAVDNPAKDLSPYVTPSNPDITVNAKSLQALQSYFKHNPRAFAQLKDDLHYGKSQTQIKLVENGNHFLLFPKYQLWIKVYRPQVETNHANSNLTVNGKDYGQMLGGDQNYYQDLGLVFPGRYHLLVETKVSGRKLKADSVANIWSGKTINLKIKTGTFIVRSVPLAKVYINDKYVKQLNKDGQASFKNYPLTRGMELYVRAEYGGEKINSLLVRDLAKKIESDFSKSDDTASDYGDVDYFEGNQKNAVYQDVEGDYVVNPLWPGLIDRASAYTLLRRTYLKPEADDFISGKDNETYQQLKHKLKKFTKIKKRQVGVKIIQLLPAGNNYSDLTYQISYKYKSKKKTKVVKLDQAHVLIRLKDDKFYIDKTLE